MSSPKTIFASLAICLVAAPSAYAHSPQTRWPHEGRLAFDGVNYVQADYLWHIFPGGFETSDAFPKSGSPGND